MKNRVVTISDNGKVTVPSETKMSIAEIADLFGIYYPTAKRHIRTIEKSGIADGDFSQSYICEGSKVYPEYYGLGMIIAVAFRVKSRNAELFRKWVIRKTSKAEIPQISEVLILSTQNSSLN